jgi:hypothetical protein
MSSLIIRKKAIPRVYTPQSVPRKLKQAVFYGKIVGNNNEYAKEKRLTSSKFSL